MIVAFSTEGVIMTDQIEPTIEDAVKIDGEVHVVVQYHTDKYGEPFERDGLPEQTYGVKNPANQVLYSEADLLKITDAFASMGHGGGELDFYRNALINLHNAAIEANDLNAALEDDGLKETTLDEFKAIEPETNADQGATVTQESTLAMAESAPELKV